MTQAPETLLAGSSLTRLTALLYRLTGMKFDEKKRFYLERRVAHRMDRTATTDIARYLLLLERDAHERQMLINAVTINETYFFREEHQLTALADEILPRIAAEKRPGDLIRIWSLPCSTGEEAYSIALWLLERWPLVDAYHVEIVGSDIDTHALDAARDGQYGARALARLPADMLAAYFEREHQHRRRIVQDLRESVLFTQANLNDAASVASQGRFDIVLCRNLLIYFDDESRIAAARHLHEALLPGGYLLLGHSESMARIDERFDLVRLRQAIVYRRR
ncbi:MULTISPECIES: protein-glutamate O-methyltransferase CheR [Sphingobium]|jgi:chemotaxis protein methyltransferase CheR|uniref:protein-glutamate O-methyltransferase n=1 Tax=Sphingobium fuliginis ATCC 27551 TaxID=1208342 RepID=A0A5B8CN64_SPHSA|nr:MULTISPECIES: protein-glutamate O-methyltransferase CheR [Sphingobium]OAP33099.1 chemotaxis protein CheR [Sphingobium sp. 20006FA]AJR23904.1 chemotaxis protein CheR [Sphingobium sp. YBL2]KXU32203.1 chemotaxis protein CheR [Sphingobium sp. AM]KYC32097.1 chemotaxis protein CheR [Sphingobium sp. 22B]QDC40103.1 protein-glutamate O-methyltransferase CheR [Sphingobium fuliginis ATCC 27551]